MRTTMMALEEENREMKARIAALEKEIEFLKTHPTLVQGMKGETLIAKITGGVLGAYADTYDLVVGETIKVEVKFSKLNTPVAGSSTRRWNWSKPLGWKDKGKDYDFLLLVGNKDPRFLRQYLDDSPYVYFLVPRTKVTGIMNSGEAIGANVQIITNLAKAKSPTSLVIKQHMVREAAINELLASALPP
jgi:hypothetical protein